MAKNVQSQRRRSGRTAAVRPPTQVGTGCTPRELDTYSSREALDRLNDIGRTIKEGRKPTAEDRYFMAQITQGVERLFIQEIRRRQARIPGLDTGLFGHLGVWGGELSPGCRVCLNEQFVPIRSVSRCNLRCRFCYYAGDDDQDEPLPHDRFAIADRRVSARDLELMLHKVMAGPNPVQGIAWVWYEPFVAFEKHPELVRVIRDHGIHQHMYTNGTLCTRENLTELANAGLNEIRFNLAATNCADAVLDKMDIARQLFPYLCVESPMLPEYYAAFMGKRERILATGVDHLHCAELHLGPRNLPHYARQALYQYRDGYISPLFSRRLTYDLLDIAVREDWKDIVIHDCSNEVKFARGVSSDRMGMVDYDPEIKGLPIIWYRDALLQYGPEQIGSGPSAVSTEPSNRSGPGSSAGGKQT